MLSTAVIHECWHLAQGRCECQRDGQGHHGRCAAALQAASHGLIGEGGWFAREWVTVDQGRMDEPGNGEALCWRRYERVIRQAA